MRNKYIENNKNLKMEDVDLLLTLFIKFAQLCTRSFTMSILHSPHRLRIT